MESNWDDVFEVDSNLMLSGRLEDAEGVEEDLEGAVKSWVGC